MATIRLMAMRACLLAASLSLCVAAVPPGIAQKSTAQQSGTPQSGSNANTDGQAPAQKKQQTPPAHKSAAEDNPFPSDVSEHAAQQQQQNDQPAPPASAAPDAPDTGQPTSPSSQRTGDAAKDNPFPEDVSKGAAAAASKGSSPDAPSDSSSSSSSSSSSNPGGDVAGADADPNADVPSVTGRRKHRPADKDTHVGSAAGEGTAQDDVRIGRFYLAQGNYKGAYGRYSEAARLDPTNLDAIYGLAASADGLHHVDEALTNYKLYLDVAPDGDQAKSARKAIRALSK